jgi:hypothetical protein
VSYQTLPGGKGDDWEAISEITGNMGVEHMRQLRSKFDQLDTYNLSRRSVPLTATSLHRPYTIFIMGEQRKKEGLSYGTGRLLFAISEAVLFLGDKAKLCLDEVYQGLSKKDLEMCLSAQDFLHQSVPLWSCLEKRPGSESLAMTS